ncbi:DUF3747 domain-containing protein [Allocoleopsis franciscana]|uniref:Putative S-layer protein n=1 Tax=Allocoleopsis franciscana PCC 7113 TaxID=1173027 RepID=K9WM01_9CYAN|nr:DUF3747 domain-containing protein [Allocoleopsis franciscana]AFZ20804.1 putative S-layer protein [Allocoleopsis franciscana PCC 7113]
MKTSFRGTVAAFATVLISIIGAGTLAKAATFGKQEVDQNKFVAVAAPYGNNQHQLLLIEQISSKRPCWSESGSNPVTVDPLLLNFDFSGICGRSTDSNGYSMRLADEDFGLQYLLNVVQRNGELQLIATSRTNRTAPDIVIGRTRGLTSGFAKIFLEPGWRLTKRTYEGKTLGHVYLTNDLTLASIAGSGSGSGTGTDTGTGTGTGSGTGSGTGTGTGSGTGTGTGTDTTTIAFRDIASDVYASEINQAVALGFVAGFREDNTFRPQLALTREQLVSMVIEALGKLPGANFTVPTQVATSPYPDVAASRWSAAKIQWARDNKIVSGYTDGTFRPTQPVTRAELMAVQRRAAEYAQTLQGRQATLTPKQSAQQFSDTQGHWAASLISQMSSYCGVASPVNETGSLFAPDTQTRRNYAAAATLRMLNCVKSESTTTP